jgi:hypothetical protein
METMLHLDHSDSGEDDFHFAIMLFEHQKHFVYWFYFPLRSDQHTGIED